MEVVPFTADLLTGSWFGIIRLDAAGAAQLLEHNTHNRKVSAGRVRQYAAAMKDGRWMVSADAISIEEGRLVNGQHRCRALVSLDDPNMTILVPLMVNVGVAFDVLDNGATRSAADILFLAGLSENPEALARAAKLYLSEAELATSNQRSDNKFIEKWVVDHADLDRWVTWAVEVRRSSRSPFAGLFYVPAAVLGFAVENVQNEGAHSAGLSLPGRRISGAARVPDLEELRRFMHSMMTRTGIEENSVEEVLTSHLDRWRERAAGDRRTAEPANSDLLRMLTWGIDQITTGRTPTRYVMPAGRWLWAPAPQEQHLEL